MSQIPVDKNIPETSPNTLTERELVHGLMTHQMSISRHRDDMISKAKRAAVAVTAAFGLVTLAAYSITGPSAETLDQRWHTARQTCKKMANSFGIIPTDMQMRRCSGEQVYELNKIAGSYALGSAGLSIILAAFSTSAGLVYGFQAAEAKGKMNEDKKRLAELNRHTPAEGTAPQVV